MTIGGPLRNMPRTATSGTFGTFGLALVKNPHGSSRITRVPDGGFSLGSGTAGLPAAPVNPAHDSLPDILGPEPGILLHELPHQGNALGVMPDIELDTM
jgi:hypothetical protein